MKGYFIKGLFKNKKRFYRIENMNFKFPRSPLSFYGSDFKYYELSERILVNKYLDENDVVLELGANVGVLSCFINKKIKYSSNQVSIEANDNIINLLQINKERNGCNFIIENSILSNEKGKSDFYINQSVISSSIYKRDNNLQKISVNRVSKSILEKKYDLKFNCLIMDIEGGEYDVIKTIEFTNIKKIILELHNEILSKKQINFCNKKLKDEGFNLTDKINSVEYWEKLN